MPAAVRGKSAAGAKKMSPSAAATKFKNVLLRTNAQEDRLLNTALDRLEREKKRRFTHSTQEQRSFLLRCNQQPEPTIIVERSPSPVNMRKAYIMTHGMADEFENEIYRQPHYMRPLKTRAKTPSTLATIDAYVVRTRKKVNIWEEPVVRKDDLPKFISVVVPSNPLSRPEAVELNRGWEIQRNRRQSPPPKTPISTRPDQTRRPLPIENRPRTMPAPRRRTVQASRTFITEFAGTKPRDGAAVVDDAASLTQSLTSSHAVNDVVRVNKAATVAEDGRRVSADARTGNARRKNPRTVLKKVENNPQVDEDEDEVFVDDDTKENIQNWLKAAKPEKQN